MNNIYNERLRIRQQAIKYLKTPISWENLQDLMEGVTGMSVPNDQYQLNWYYERFLKIHKEKLKLLKK
mgnify:CR=1 FL=1